MRVEVDLDLCEANGVCVGIAPTVFDLDAHDLLHVVTHEVPEHLEDDLRLAASLCPKLALALTEE